jgi:hypothetical protein
MGEWEAWLKAGTGDNKTDIVVIADFWERTGGLFSRDRDLSANAFYVPFGGISNRSGTFPGRVGDFPSFRLVPSMFFGPGGLPRPGVNTPLPHSAPNVATSPFYIFPSDAFGTPAATHAIFGIYPDFKGGGDYFAFNSAAFTPALPPADRQAYYGSFTRDLCDKYLTMFADFKYVRSFFEPSFAAVQFGPDPFASQGTGVGFSLPSISVPISNPFNPFTVPDATLVINGVPVPVTQRVFFRGINDAGSTHDKITYWDSLFDVGLRGEMGEFWRLFQDLELGSGFPLCPKRGAGFVDRRGQPDRAEGCAPRYESSDGI